MTAVASTDHVTATVVAQRPWRRKTRSRTRRLVEELGVLVVGVAFWEMWTIHRGSFFFPRPSDIIVHLHALWFSGPATSLFLTSEFHRDVAPSMGRMFAGLGLATIGGVLLGTLLGLSRRVSAYVEPVLHFLRSAPGPALLPIFMLLFGIGTDMKIVFIAFGSVWPILLNTLEGVRSVDPRQIDTARSFRTPWTSRLLHIVLPATTPKIVAGMRISLAIALVLMVISDMVAASNGFGFALVSAQRSFDVETVWAAIVLLGIIGYVLNALFVAVERRLLGWHVGFRAQQQN